MYLSLEQISNDFNLNSGLKDEIRKELKKKLAECQPDKKNGEFKAVEQKEEFEKINLALDYLDTPVDVALRKEISNLALVVKDLATRKDENEFLNRKEERLIKKIDNSMRTYASAHLIPIITAVIFAGILSIILFFPKPISEHEILSRYINIHSNSFPLLWLVAVLAAVNLKLFFTILERKDKKRKNSLKLESTQNMLFNEFISFNIKHHNIAKNKTIQSTKEKFAFFIRNFDLDSRTYKLRRRSLFFIPLRVFIGDSRIDMGVAEDLSEIILNRMLAKDLINVKTQKTIADIFTVKLDEDLYTYYQEKSKDEMNVD